MFGSSSHSGLRSETVLGFDLGRRAIVELVEAVHGGEIREEVGLEVVGLVISTVSTMLAKTLRRFGQEDRLAGQRAQRPRDRQELHDLSVGRGFEPLTFGL